MSSEQSSAAVFTLLLWQLTPILMEAQVELLSRKLEISFGK